MAKQLPEKWISGKTGSLNLKADLNLKGDYPSSLTIYKRKETELYQIQDDGNHKLPDNY